MCMVNLFALRSTNPKDMISHPDPIGPDNDEWLISLSNKADVTVAAWGVNGTHMNREAKVKEMVSGLWYLDTTKDGHPKHPLYLKSTLKPTRLIC